MERILEANELKVKQALEQEKQERIRRKAELARLEQERLAELERSEEESRIHQENVQKQMELDRIEQEKQAALELAQIERKKKEDEYNLLIESRRKDIEAKIETEKVNALQTLNKHITPLTNK